MSFLEIDHLEKFYGAAHVVKDFSLSVEPGEFVSFLGPSGCGKTTTLRMVAGFETPSQGTIRIGGKDVTGLKPSKRNIGMVFQAYALFPNLTVAQNVAFGLSVAGVAKAEAARRVDEMLALIKLPDLGSRYPFQLSGGQQQRVALARALAHKPQVLLLDEPLSALDAKIRVSLREEIRAIQKDLGITTIYVTHDQEEALSMSDRIVVMNQGVAEQVGTPFEIYNQPTTRFVASFVGTLNLLNATVVDASAGTVTAAGQTMTGLKLNGKAQNGDSVVLALRPESLHRTPRPGDITLPGIIRSVDFLGSVMRTRLTVAGQDIAFDAFNDPATPPLAPGAESAIHVSPGTILVLPAGA